MTLQIGNLHHSLEEFELWRLFTAYGQVISVKIARDAITGRGKGFGFVEMNNETEAIKAINLLNGSELKNRIITVKVKP